MLLAIDAGNTNTVLGLYDGESLVADWRMSTVHEKAAHVRYGGPAIVIDFGTATTFDVVSPDGEYLGGAISPGLVVASEALFRYTAQLRRIELVAPRSPIGKNTVHAMQSGVVWGYISLVEGMVARIR